MPPTTELGGAKHHHSMGNIIQIGKEGGKKVSTDNKPPGTTTPDLDTYILCISTAGIKYPTNNLSNAATIDNSNNG